MTRLGRGDMTFQGNLAEMSTLLSRMQDTGEVDLAIVPKIEDSMELLTEMQNTIVNSKTTEAKQDFLAYHIIRNINLTMEKMKARFLVAKEMGDNPIVADDSIALVPVLSESFQVAEGIMSGKLTSVDQRLIMERIRVLRDSMYSSSMQITSEEESKRAPTAELEQEGKRLATAVKDLYTQKQQDTS
jgi:hypothetical protein